MGIKHILFICYALFGFGLAVPVSPGESGYPSQMMQNQTEPLVEDSSGNVQCEVVYEVLFDVFDIVGKDWDASKLGTKGAGLKKELKNCGALTGWEFKSLTNDPDGFQWNALGNLPIGTKKCVGMAVLASGGDSVDKCHGAG